MKRFLITNPKFTGSAELIYDDNGLLQKIDLLQAAMSPDTITAFKRAIPVSEKYLSESFSPQTVIVQADLEVTFEMFWTAYRKKINRLRAEQLWKKLSKTEQVQAYYGVSAYDKYLQKTDWRNKADPDTYLRNKYFQNEYK